MKVSLLIRDVAGGRRSMFRKSRAKTVRLNFMRARAVFAGAVLNFAANFI